MNSPGARGAQRSIIEAMYQRSANGIESTLEWRFHVGVLRTHGLPLPDRQVRKGRHRLDNLFRNQRLIVELDGMRDHAGNWSDDMLRDNQHLLSEDLFTLRYGWRAVTRQACVVAAQVTQALVRFGWAGELRPCPNCPALMGTRLAA